MAPKQVAHFVDVHVGQQIRLRRRKKGMTQQQLAEKVGVKFQQIQKYETGMNRVSASRLWDIAQVLQVPSSVFFAGLEVADSGSAASNTSLPVDRLGDKETQELVRYYYSIPENQRRRLFELAKVLADLN